MSNENKHKETIHKALVRHLSDGQQIRSASMQFSALETNAQRVDFVCQLLDDNELFPELVVDRKNNESAANLRREGNDLFKRKKDELALEFYTKSVALAEPDSEHIALAFANRSAVLFEKGLYRECLADIDRALDNPYPDHLKPKLLSRQQKASELKQKQAHSDYFELLPQLPSKNELIQSAADSVVIKYTAALGRHVIAKQDIAIGDIIAIEKPFCRILIEQHFNHCHECLQLCYNLVPCPHCSQALYCGEKCRSDASFYHKYECRILATVKSLGMDVLKLLPMKIAISVKYQYKEIQTGCDLGKDEVYRSDRYKEIHNLVSNTEKRSVSDLFDRATTCAVIYHLVRTYTNFLKTAEDELMFKELVLLHLQTSACNFHEISELVENDDGIYEESEIGAGAYSFLSLFNHSCSPNVVRHCYGSVIVVRAIRSIKMGEQCYDNYGYHHAIMVRDERRAKLKKQYFFDCACEVCEFDWPLYKNLLEIKTDVEVLPLDLLKLQDGDVHVAKAVLAQILPRMNELEKFLPNKNFAEMQETIKQCFALLGNIRRPL